MIAVIDNAHQPAPELILAHYYNGTFNAEELTDHLDRLKAIRNQLYADISDLETFHQALIEIKPHRLIVKKNGGER
jgi:hypothetical protein